MKRRFSTDVACSVRGNLRRTRPRCYQCARCRTARRAVWPLSHLRHNASGTIRLEPLASQPPHRVKQSTSNSQSSTLAIGMPQARHRRKAAIPQGLTSYDCVLFVALPCSVCVSLSRADCLLGFRAPAVQLPPGLATWPWASSASMVTCTCGHPRRTGSLANSHSLCVSHIPSGTTHSHPTILSTTRTVLLHMCPQLCRPYGCGRLPAAAGLRRNI